MLELAGCWIAYGWMTEIESFGPIVVAVALGEDEDDDVVGICCCGMPCKTAFVRPLWLWFDSC